MQLNFQFTVSLVFSCLLILPLLAPHSVAAAEAQYTVVVEAGEHEYQDVPIAVAIPLPKVLLEARTASVTANEFRTVGQITAPSLMASQDSSRDARELVFIVPSLSAGDSTAFNVTVSNEESEPTNDTSQAAPSFVWDDNVGTYAQLSFGDRPVLRYMYSALDESTAEARERTIKVFHHVFDPAGKQIVTKGPGGKFSHHRGLFYGFNRIRYGDHQADIWHCRKGESQQHVETLGIEAGPVLGRHRVAIDWRGQDGNVFANELREMTAYHVPNGLLIEFASRLSSVVGPVTLDGDPQHAGFQFRASQEVADTTHPQTYYLRPDGRGDPGETRNWTPKKPEHKNLPWNAQSFVLGDDRFTCCYLDHPRNPKPARYSERDYGRFGSYFEYELDQDRALNLNYRVWLQAGEMETDSVAARSVSFVSPPAVKLESR